MSLQSKSRLCLIVGLVFCVVAAFVAAVTHRGMIDEGGELYYAVLSLGRFSNMYCLVRAIRALYELPAVAASYLFVSHGRDMGLVLLDFAFASSSLLSLFFVHRILRRRGREELFVFPLLSYATATMLIIIFSELALTPVLDFFWPVFFLVLLRPREDAASLRNALLLFIPLCFMHEAAIMIFPMLFATALLKYVRSGPRGSRDSRELLVLIASVAGVVWYLLRITDAAAPRTESFVSTFMSPLGPFRTYCLFAIAGVGGALLLAVRSRAFERASLAVLAVGACGAVIWLFGIDRSWMQAPLFEHRSARSSVLPLAMIVAGQCLLLERGMREQSWRLSPLRYWINAVVGILLVCSSLYDLQRSRIWTEGLKAAIEYGNASPKPCLTIPSSVPTRLFLSPGVFVVLQGKQVSKLVFQEHPDLPGVDICETYKPETQSFRIARNNYFRLDMAYYDFSSALTFLQRR